MKIALAQIPVVRSAVDQNIAALRRYAEEASQEGADVVCFPEMCTTGFDWATNRKLLDTAAATIEQVRALAVELEIALCGSFLEKTEKGNSANTFYFVEADGTVTAKYRKMHLFSLFHEERHVEAGDEIIVAETSLGKLGCSICYDLRFPELFRSCMMKGAIVQLLPAAFPHPRLTHWQTLLRARAIENQSFFIAVNQCGVERHGDDVGDTQYFGHSTVVDPWGEVLVEADESEGVFYAQINLAKVTKARKKLTALEDRRPSLYLR